MMTLPFLQNKEIDKIWEGYVFMIYYISRPNPPSSSCHMLSHRGEKTFINGFVGIGRNCAVLSVTVSPEILMQNCCDLM